MKQWVTSESDPGFQLKYDDLFTVQNSDVTALWYF